MLYDILGTYQDYNGLKSFKGEISTAIDGSFAGTVTDPYGVAQVVGCKTADELRFDKTYSRECARLLGVELSSRTLWAITADAIKYSLNFVEQNGEVSVWKGHYFTQGGGKGSVDCTLVAKI